MACSCKAWAGDTCSGQSSALTRMGLSVKAEESFIQRRREDLRSEAHISTDRSNNTCDDVVEAHAMVANFLSRYFEHFL